MDCIDLNLHRPVLQMEELHALHRVRSITVTPCSSMDLTVIFTLAHVKITLMI